MSEQSRARYPDEQGHVERDGVRVFYERYGAGERSVFLLPTWSLAHSRVWKAQMPYLARHFRVLTCDPRGNGRSDRPREPEAYAEQQFADDALAVMDATGTERAVLVSLSRGAERCLRLAAGHPERVAGAVFIAPGVPLGDPLPRRAAAGAFEERRERYEGWQKFNRHYWLEHYEDFAEFFASQLHTEPHSTKQREDAIGWALETDPETMIATRLAPQLHERGVRALAARVRCPVLVLHGSEDALRPPEAGAELARLTGGHFVLLEGCGHVPLARDPVRVNLLLRDFVDPAAGRPRAWRRAPARPRRALYLSSPIGLGHVGRDLAIARELRRLHPDLEIEWLAQHPVTEALEAEGERVHPAGAELAGEARHLESEAEGHDLHAFRAFRRMDEILLANFMVFHEVAEDGRYDLWIGDEAWEVDHFLHENPELKTARYCFLTDFVGWLPVPEGGPEEARLTADYNAEMLEQVARFPRVRDRAIFVGSPADVVPQAFGDGMPPIRRWVQEHFDFCGYVLAPEAGAPVDREAVRAEVGWGPDERVCVVAVGGSGIGDALLRRAVEAFPAARRREPALRMVAVCGPRIDPGTLPAHEGLEAVGYVHRLWRALAACDAAVVQGGLTTCMELAVAKRPFVYFPLRRHFEQTLHVRHRLERYRAGRAMDFHATGPDELGGAIAAAVRSTAAPREVERDGARRAAALIAEVLR